MPIQTELTRLARLSLKVVQLSSMPQPNRSINDSMILLIYCTISIVTSRDDISPLRSVRRISPAPFIPQWFYLFQCPTNLLFMTVGLYDSLYMMQELKEWTISANSLSVRYLV